MYGLVRVIYGFFTGNLWVLENWVLKRNFQCMGFYYFFMGFVRIIYGFFPYSLFGAIFDLIFRFFFDMFIEKQKVENTSTSKSDKYGIFMKKIVSNHYGFMPPWVAPWENIPSNHLESSNAYFYGDMCRPQLDLPTPSHRSALRTRALPGMRPSKKELSWVTVPGPWQS